MKLLNELLTLSETSQGTGLVGQTIGGRPITNETKDEVWSGDFYCGAYNLTSLEGAPKEVTGNFNCDDNPNLRSLKGSPEKVGTGSNGGYFTCDDNPKLESLEGAPKEVGDFYCNHNPMITSLKGIHKQITHMTGKFAAFNTPIKSHVLGLLMNGCTSVRLANKKVEDILNKYLPNTKGNKAVIECQSELLDADLEDFAEL